MMFTHQRNIWRFGFWYFCEDPPWCSHIKENFDVFILVLHWRSPMIFTHQRKLWRFVSGHVKQFHVQHQFWPTSPCCLGNVPPNLSPEHGLFLTSNQLYNFSYRKNSNKNKTCTHLLQGGGGASGGEILDRYQYSRQTKSSERNWSNTCSMNNENDKLDNNISTWLPTVHAWIYIKIK